MNLSDWISIISILIAILAFVYSIFSNTKKYELTYQYYNDILFWHNQVVEVLISLRLNVFNEENKNLYMTKLSTYIEQGRFYFPNVNKNDGYGNSKLFAYQGYRNVILDFLVYSYQLYSKKDYKKYGEHAEHLQRLFTSYVFQYLEPRKRRKQVNKITFIKEVKEFTLDDFLLQSPDAIYKFYQ